MFRKQIEGVINLSLPMIILFFENHQHVIDRYKQPGNFMTHLPSVILSGHQDGSARSAYLLELLAKK